MVTTKHTAARREPLSRDQVLRAAVALADQGGIGALSMRKLGQVLGVEAMSLYNHVANKSDLLDGMIDIVFSEIGLPAGDSGWKQAMRQRAISAREVLARHRWAIGLMESRRSPGPGDTAPPRRRPRMPAPGRLPGRSNRPRLLAARQLYLRIRAAGGQPSVRHAGEDHTGRAGDLRAVRRWHIPPPHRADHPARPAARLPLRRRIRDRARPHPRCPRASRQHGGNASVSGHVPVPHISSRPHAQPPARQPDREH